MGILASSTAKWRVRLAVATVASLLVAAPVAASPRAQGSSAQVSPAVEVIVQPNVGAERAAIAAMQGAGAAVVERLPLVDGWLVRVPAAAVDRLRSARSIRAVSLDSAVTFEQQAYDATTTASNFVRTAGAGSAWSGGVLGAGVGVAVIDTGVSSMPDLAGRVVFGPDLSGEGSTIDTYGHGTVMAGIIAGSGTDANGARPGVAPRATLVSVKVAGRNGATDVSTVLKAMHWVSAYKDQLGIRVLNLSWGTPSTQDPRLDPLNFAVERLWQQGIVVVAAAGNSGPTSGSITKPGDDPMVITVGAFNDGQNTLPGDDAVPGWSSRGPTALGVSKPDVVAPGRSLVAARSYGSTVEAENPKALVSPSYIKGSGTSQAAAVTSGVAALLLERRPELTPDQVKHLLRSTAKPIDGVSSTIQGAGRVDLGAALTADPGAPLQQVAIATGLGALDASRGGLYVETDCAEDGTVDLIRGEITDRCEPWTPAAWTGNSWTGNSWTGNSWTGNSWTASTWTGNSWTGGTWTGNSWTGNSWTGNSWTGNSWTGSTWTGNSWTGNSWTTAEYEDDAFLTKYWGARAPVLRGPATMTLTR